MIDAGIYLRAYFVADAGVQAQVSTDARGGYRVYVGGSAGAGIPQSDAGLMPRKCIVLLPTGGSPIGRRMPLLHPSFWIRCYGPSMLEATEVYAAAHALLQRQQNVQITVGANKAILYWAEKDIELQPIPEPTTEWPCVGSPFNCTFYEDAV